jgi:hypothetical protein
MEPGLKSCPECIVAAVSTQMIVAQAVIANNLSHFNRPLALSRWPLAKVKIKIRVHSRKFAA